MAKRRPTHYGSILALMAGIAIAAPAAAVKDFSNSGALSDRGIGTPGVIENVGLKKSHRPAARKSNYKSMPEPTSWLFMVAGFVLLGAVGRRETPSTLQDELVS